MQANRTSFFSCLNCSELLRIFGNLGSYTELLRSILNYWELNELLKRKGIGTRPFFWPMNKQSILKKMKLPISGNYKNSEYISKFGFYLPSSIDMSKKEIDYICKEVNKIFS